MACFVSRRQAKGYLRADGAVYGDELIAAARRGGLVLHHRPALPRRHRRDQRDPGHRVDDPLPEVIFDEELQQWVSDDDVAEIPFTLSLPAATPITPPPS